MKNARREIAFIGAGRLGGTLAIALVSAGYEVKAIYDRDEAAAAKLAATVKANVAGSAADAARQAPIVFITTTDDAIAAVAAGVAAQCGWSKGQVVAHTSGALASEVLQAAREQGAAVASMHPLQTFPLKEGFGTPLAGIAFTLEGDQKAVAALEVIVEELGGQPFGIRPGDKMLYHAAAAMASNYLVTVFSIAVDLFAVMGIDRREAAEQLLPLAAGTVSSMENPGLPDCLTGPIARGDAGTVIGHLEALAARCPQLLDIYCRLGLATLPIAEEKGSLDAATAGEMRTALTRALRPSKE